MLRARRLAVLVAGLLVVTSAVAGRSFADGLPLIGIDAGPGGVPARSGDVRYVTLPAGGNTVLATVAQDGGEVVASTFLRGTLAVPVVAFDGTPSGVSADGSTLVLIKPRAAFPRARTTFAVLATDELRTRERVTLRGDFSFDAVSPDGELLYLIEYTSRTDPTRYRVRLYDAVAGRLLPEPVVDPSEPDERMRGYPITRTPSPDGRWEYTLYDGAGATPFVHALDTEGRRAVCIDLDALAGRGDLYDLRLGFDGDGRALTVGPSGMAVLAIDTATFRVSEGSTTAGPVRSSAQRVVSAPPLIQPDRGPAAWLLVAGVMIAVGVVAATGWITRRTLRRSVRAETAAQESGSRVVSRLFGK